MLKALIWLLLMVVIVSVILVPTAYLRAASSVPALDSAIDIQARLSAIIEVERRAHSKEFKPSASMTFETPKFEAIAPQVRNLFLSSAGCANYLNVEKSDKLTFAKKILKTFFFSKSEMAYGCELNFALHVASHLSLDGKQAQAVAAFRIQSTLTHAQLLAYTMETVNPSPGVYGIEAVNAQSVQKEIEGMSLAETAELLIAMMSPEGYRNVVNCSNVVVLKSERSQVIQSAKELGEAVRSDAEKAPLNCESRERKKQ